MQSPDDLTAEAPVERRTWDAARLVADHPPHWTNSNKQVVFDIACPPGSAIAGRIEYSRWPELPLPERVLPLAPGVLSQVPGFFDYAREPELPGAFVWHLNFAAWPLFGWYAGGSAAQDELQVAEHPVLASVREALLAEGAIARTVVEDRPTPVLVRGAERRARIDTQPDAAAGRPDGLYGRSFPAATPDVVAKAATRLVPPTISNILAIAAQSHRGAPYTRDQIEWTLSAAYSGFRAAAVEARVTVGAAATIIHTGHWGGGAFRGDRVLMAVLQLAAASLAGVDQLVYYEGFTEGFEPSAGPVTEARGLFGGLVPEQGIRCGELVGALAGLGFRWRD